MVYGPEFGPTVICFVEFKNYPKYLEFYSLQPTFIHDKK
jgi:hypothetical protein